MAIKSQKGIGGLFIDLGLNGLDKMLKGLNGVSASFLLTKNAAEQALKPLASASKEAGNSILDLEKASMRMSGTSTESLYKLKAFARANHTEFSTVLNDMKSMQQSLIEIRQKGGGQFFDLVNIDPRTLDWTKPFETMEKIIRNISKIQDPSARAYAYDMLHISEETQWLYERGERTLTEYNSLNAEQLSNLKQQGILWNKINVETDVLKDKVLASGPIAKGLQKALEIIEKTHDALSGEQNVIYGIGLFIDKFMITPLKAVLSLYEKIYRFSEKLNDKPQELLDKEAQKNLQKNIFADYKKDITAGSFSIYDESTGKQREVSGISIPQSNIEALARAKKNPYAQIYTGKQGNYIVTVNQYIQGDNSRDIARDSASGVEDSISNVYNNYGASK